MPKSKSRTLPDFQSKQRSINTNPQGNDKYNISFFLWKFKHKENDVMAELEQTLDSIEIADMIEKSHSNLIRDIRRYAEQFIEAKIGFHDFFRESTYKDAKGETRPCYRITKKGCEFIAHKLTGTKGTVFTARYINRFHEMEDILKGQQEPKQPWFIKQLNGKKIMLFRDFKEITGIELFGTYTSCKRPDGLVGGRHCNGYGWKCDNEVFKAKYGFDYGEESVLYYLYLCGIRRAIRAIENDYKDRKKLTLEAKKMMLDGIASLEESQKSVANAQKRVELAKQKPIQICITINEKGVMQ